MIYSPVVKTRLYGLNIREKFPPAMSHIMGPPGTPRKEVIMANEKRRSYQTRMPWAVRTAWPQLAKAYEWYLTNSQNLHPEDNQQPPMFIPVEIYECESTKDSDDGDGSCCYSMYLGHRLCIAFWTHSARDARGWRVWLTDRIIIEDDDDLVREWKGPEQIALLS